MLHLVASPIGYLKDLSFHAIDVLGNADYILCEDTRHSRKLLNHYDIDKPTKSYHLFNEAKRESGIIRDLKEGKKIALLSDAGTPGINDPGERLVRKCHAEGIEVSAVGGPCSLIIALILSGLSTERFQFLGFLPKKSGKRKKILQEALDYPGTTVCFESPHRILKALKELESLDPEREVAIARELTKKFEQVLKGNATEILTHFANKEPKGEFVLLIGRQGKDKC